ncbi:hypothetical protein UFOVP380_26 [uncultured Caudovirales phage]|uniref:Phage neck terminator protein gp12-like domain-containing protein n=1 Tax=uncultured Caudovirales phage TaxID=2100421 RepID=A0A6J7WZ29_9CAUD|nr:hypothetical protein UFOVP380_26 [uncultured Caudovirales phage]
MNELYTPLIAYFVLLAGNGVPVIRANQNAPAPNAPYITLNVQSQVRTGSFRTDIASNGTQTLQRTYAFALDVNLYGKEGGQVELETLVQRVLDGLEDDTQRMLTLSDIALQEVVQPPTDVSALFSEHWQPRYNFALRLHTSRQVVYTGSTIDTVNVDHTLEAP